MALGQPAEDKGEAFMDFATMKREVTNTYFRNTDLDLTNWRAQFDDDLSRTVVSIPARSGSTRVKDKNVMSVAGLPLLAYTIKVALAVPGVDRVIVNTDSARYARIAERFGAEAPFLRPNTLASTKSNPYWAYYYLFRHLVDEDYPVKTIITLPPTNPFRNVSHLSRLVSILKEKGGVQTVMGVNLDEDTISYDNGERVVPIDAALPEGKVLFKPLGHFIGQHCLHEHIQGKHYEFLTNPIELVDIDTYEDIQTAEQIIESCLYDFGVAI